MIDAIVKEPLTEVEKAKEPWQVLKDRTVPIRMSFKRFGTVRSMSKEERDKIAAIWDIDPDHLKAGKKIINTKNHGYSAIISAMNACKKYWEINTYKYPEKGVGLGRKAWIPTFITKMDQLIEEVDTYVQIFQNDHWDDMKVWAQENLKGIYVPEFYPEDITNRFSVKYSFPSLNVDDYIKKFHPELSQSQESMVMSQCKDAITMSYNMFLKEFQGLVKGLAKQMGPDKMLMNMHVDKCHEFIKWFDKMDVGGNTDFTGLVKQAQDILDGCSASDLKKDPGMHQKVKEGMEEASAALAQMIEDQEDRTILFWDDHE